MEYIFETKLCRDPLYERNEEKVEVLEKGEVFSKVKFVKDGLEKEIFTNEIKEFREEFAETHFAKEELSEEETVIEYVVSSDGKEEKELAKHLSLNGYKAAFKENGLLSVPEEERHEVETILEDRLILSCKRGLIRQLDITKEDVRCCDELIVEDDKINATYELWFDVDQYFGWETRYFDGIWINFYTDWNPVDGSVTASYTVDGDLYFHEEWELTDEEKKFFLNKMEAFCKETCNETLKEFWISFCKDTDPEYGNCNTCRHYSKCNICSDCIEGSLYEYFK